MALERVFFFFSFSFFRVEKKIRNPLLIPEYNTFASMEHSGIVRCDSAASSGTYPKPEERGGAGLSQDMLMLLREPGRDQEANCPVNGMLTDTSLHEEATQVVCKNVPETVQLSSPCNRIFTASVFICWCRESNNIFLEVLDANGLSARLFFFQYQ